MSVQFLGKRFPVILALLYPLPALPSSSLQADSLWLTFSPSHRLETLSDFCGHHRRALLAPWQPPLPRCCSWQRSAALSRSVMSDSATPWTVAHQAPQSMAFSKHKYWSGLQFPPPGDPPNSGIEPMSPLSPALAGGFFTTEPPGKPISALCVCVCVYYIYPLLHKLPSQVILPLQVIRVNSYFLKLQSGFLFQLDETYFLLHRCRQLARVVGRNSFPDVWQEYL